MNIDALRDFLAVVDAGGVTAGAARRGVSKQSVSRRLMELEQDLGTLLLDRSTRALRLTAEGEMLKVSAQRIIADLEETRNALADRAVNPEGHLRISAPHLLGHTLLGKIAAAILCKYPQLTMEFVLSDARVDLVEEGFDCAIRVGRFEDSSLISRFVRPARTLLVAAPSRISSEGEPTAPQDLEHWPVIAFATKNGRVNWRLTNGEMEERLELPVRLAASSLKLCLDAAVAGGGVAAVPAFIGKPLIDQGKLVHILPAWSLPVAEIRIVFPSRRLMSARLRVFIDEAAQQLQTIEF
jgi:LysR family transcriptional regulator, regulator for bpeEF and oprC